jgi:hypothetical protein
MGWSSSRDGSGDGRALVADGLLHTFATRFCPSSTQIRVQLRDENRDVHAPLLQHGRVEAFQVVGRKNAIIPQWAQVAVQHVQHGREAHAVLCERQRATAGFASLCDVVPVTSLELHVLAWREAGRRGCWWQGPS